jgi:hypothetical protein
MAGHIPLGGDWALWRDFAVRSAGFPASGLEALGSANESEALRAVARDPRFQEAVTWQNPQVVTRAIARVAEGTTATPSRMRQREELVASYWQRYCAKNDTIGFFGPLAWGRFQHAGAPLHARSGALVRERAVHLEAWGVQALAASIDRDLRIANGQYPERDLRIALNAHADSEVRARGLLALERLEAARAAVAAAPPEGLLDALLALDVTFVELVGREPTRNPGQAYGARTLCYLDCMRDLEVTIGPQLVAGMAPGLQTLLEAGRWFCGRVQEIGQEAIEDALPAAERGPFLPILNRALQALLHLPPELAATVSELQRRMSTVVADPDPGTAGRRAEAIFGDHVRAWPTAVFQSVDLQIAAPDQAAIADGDYLAVVGDVHLGLNPLTQGVFANRHPDTAAFMRQRSHDLGGGIPILLPPLAPGFGVDARGFPVTADDDIHIAMMADTLAPAGRRTWRADELEVEGMDLVDRTGALRVPLMDVLAVPLMIACSLTFELQPADDHAPRLTIGHTVLARESWSIPASEIPQQAADVAAFARDRGMPRRVFTKSPLERKPMFLDVESPTLARILCRQARRAAATPGQRIRFTEMLPTPEQSWLTDPEHNRYVSELRLVAVDSALQRRRDRCDEPREATKVP